MSNTLSLRPGTRLRTGGTTYEVIEEAQVPSNVVPVVPQATRLLKVFCETCGYTARITQRWITKAGTPECPVSDHGYMVVAASKERAETPVEKPVITAAAPAPPTRKVKNAKPPEVEQIEETLSVLNELLAQGEDHDDWTTYEEEPQEVAVEADSTSTLAQLLAEL